MATDDFWPFRGLPLMREQHAEMRANIAQSLACGESWDALGFGCTLEDMLATHELKPEDDAIV